MTYFWEQIDRGGEDECWPWTRSLRNGMHGSITRDGKKEWAHRVAFELTKGAIPEGMVVRHSCDNGRCCNPRHLSVGTQADNLADMRSRGRANTSGLLNSGRPEVSE